MARRPVLIAALGVALAAVLVHARALGAGWVYDDHRFVVNNRAIERVDPVAFFTDATTASDVEGIVPDVYRPLRTLDFAVDRALGFPTWVWHLESVLWHALAAALLVRLLVPMLGGVLGGAVLPAALAGLLFAVHPLTSEAATWVSSRGDVLALALGLAALVVLERPGAARTAVGTLLAALACFAKESMVVLPALLLLRDLALPAEVAPPRRATWIRTAVLFAVVVGYLAARAAVIGPPQQVPDALLPDRPAIARGMLSGVVWYGVVLVAPHGFPFEWMLPIPFRWTDPHVVLGAALLLAALVGGILAMRRGPRVVGFALLGALACLVPVSNVIVPLKTLVAERFLYPSLACLVAAVGWACLRWGAVRIAALGAAAVLAAITFSRDAVWADERSLWEAVRRDRPENLRAYEGLGFLAAQEGHASRAELAYRSVLEGNPNDGKTWKALGDVFGQVANSLHYDPREGEETDVVAKRWQAQDAQLESYRQALAAWQRVGLEAGRGSPRMLQETQIARYDAAKARGAMAEAKGAVDAMLLVAGFDPEATETVMTKAPWLLRFFRAVLATDVTAPAPKEEPQRAAWLAARSAVLRDVGIEPMAPDAEVRARLEPVLLALSEEQPGNRGAAIKHVNVLGALEDRSRMRARLLVLLRRFPNDPQLVRLLAWAQPR